jgi:steroid delta-isomerase-like uncharacterized protein
MKMSEENKAIIRRYLEEAWNQGRIEALDEAFAEDAVPHTAGITDLEGLKQGLARNLNAFPDIRLTIDDEMAVGDKVIVRFTISGTHQGEILGIPATGKEISFSGITIYRLAGGKIVEFWTQADTMGMMQQIGALPVPGQG